MLRHDERRGEIICIPEHCKSFFPVSNGLRKLHALLFKQILTDYKTAPCRFSAAAAKAGYVIEMTVITLGITHHVLIFGEPFPAVWHLRGDKVSHIEHCLVGCRLCRATGIPLIKVCAVDDVIELL